MEVTLPQKDLFKLLERIHLRLDESMVGIAEQLADLDAADLAELINQLNLAEAAAVVSLLPVPRAIEICDQPTMRRRAAILERLDPQRVAQILEGLSADERTDIINEWDCTSGTASCLNLHRKYGRNSRSAAISRAHGGRHHDHRVRAARSQDDGGRGAETHSFSRAREGIDLCLLCDGAEDRSFDRRRFVARFGNG